MEQLRFEAIEAMHEADVPSEVDDVELEEETRESVVDLMARATLFVVSNAGEADDER